MTPCLVTLDVSDINDVVVPCRATLIVFESKTMFDVGLETMTDFVADPLETAIAVDPPPPPDPQLVQVFPTVTFCAWRTWAVSSHQKYVVSDVRVFTGDP